MAEISISAVAAAIEHTALEPGVTRADIERLCKEARDHRLGAVCLAPAWITLAVELLGGSPVRVVAVNGFPHGDTLSPAKAAEARDSVRAGASEIDMVMQVGRLTGGDTDFVRDDIKAVVEAAGSAGPAIVKVILEVGCLSNDQIRLACLIAEEAGAGFVKTSTGFGPKETREKVDYVRLMHDAVGGRLGIKAAGGIGDLETARLVLEAGATRIGCSRSLAVTG